MPEPMGPHAGQPVLERGAGLGVGSGAAGAGAGAGRAVVVMLHGRNAGPRNIMELADLLPHPAFTYLAPAAAGNTWYPYSFLSELERNEPGLSSGLSVIDALVARV